MKSLYVLFLNFAFSWLLKRRILSIFKDGFESGCYPVQICLCNLSRPIITVYPRIDPESLSMLCCDNIDFFVS